MKKIILQASIAFFLGMGLMSCQNNIDSDAKKIATLLCEAQNLGKNVTNVDAATIEKINKLKSDSEKLMKEMETKYSSDSDKEKLRTALIKEMENCK